MPVFPALEAVLAVLAVVDEGPMTICETVVTGTTVVAVVGVVGGTETPGSVPLVVPVGVLGDAPVAIVTDGTPATGAHRLSNVSMRLCAEETTLTEGSVVMKQLMQFCRLLAMAMVQRQLVEVQDPNVDSTGAQIVSHESVCRGKIISNDCRASITRW